MMIYSQVVKRLRLSNLARVPDPNKQVDHQIVNVLAVKALAYASIRGISTYNNSRIVSNLDEPRRQ